LSWLWWQKFDGSEGEELQATGKTLQGEDD